jgi:2-polyprenyl-3-methyl-5-hydroxy-6-metoxy-1,4-benzoquinol methylase
MDESIYQIHYRLERVNWWNVARRDIIFAMLEKFCPNLSAAQLLDIGAGTGSFLEECERRGISAEGHDNSETAISFIRKSCASKAIKKKFPEDYWDSGEPKYDVVLLCDILEHVEKDRAALSVALNQVKQKGILLLTVPACKSMWSAYDVMAHHFRRYNLQEINELIQSTSATPMKISHFSTLLFPFMFTIRFMEARFLDHNKAKMEYRPHFVPPILNHFLRSIFKLEKFALERFNLPFGSSIIAVLQKV